MCLGLVQFLQLATKKLKKGYQNDVNNDGAGAKAMMDVTIAADNKAATTSIKEDEGNHLW